MSITPAYGRTYTRMSDIEADLVADKDFVHQPSGKYINLSDIRTMTSESYVQIRYGPGLRKTAAFHIVDLLVKQRASADA